MKKGLCVPALVGAALVLGGCATYYQVREPSGGRAYYTTDIDATKAGAIKFKDDKSGASITLQNSEVREITEDEYKKGIEQPAAPEK